MMMMMSTE